MVTGTDFGTRLRWLLGGVLLGLSYMPWPLLVVNFTAFVPLLAWLEARPQAAAAERFRAGLGFGWVAHLIAMHWQYALLDFSWLAVLLYLAFTLALGLRIALQVTLLGWLRRRTALPWGVLLPLCWVPVEWLQSFGDLKMTGEHLAHTLAGYPFLVQFADVTGPYGVATLLLAVNGLVFDALSAWSRGRRPRALRALAALAILLALVLGYDARAWGREVPASGSVRIGLVQPNVPLSVKHGEATGAEQSAILTRLTEEAARQGAELVAWPESARPGQVHHLEERPDSYRMPEIQALAERLGVAMLVGVEYVRFRTREEYTLYNAALAVEPSGAMRPEWSAKIYLVPFVEATPFRSLLGPLVEGRGGEWRWISGTFAPGPAGAVIPLAGASVGVLVCYEQLFADLARAIRNAGATVGIVITNDAWFGRSLFQTYQANALRLRAIENRCWFVRVANTGISGFVDPHGRYHGRTELFEEAVVVRDVPLTGGRTIYGATGNVVAWVAAAALVLLAGWARFGYHGPGAAGRLAGVPANPTEE